MILKIETSDNAAAFRTVGEITAYDYKTVIIPSITALMKRINEINFLFLIDNEVENFNTSAWLEDTLIGLRNLGKWNRTAVVTECEKAISFTNSFRYIVSGEFRCYKKESFQEALNWVQGKELPVFNTQEVGNEPCIDPDDLGEENQSNGYSDSDDIDYNYKP